jgi:hypothetical protein
VAPGSWIARMEGVVIVADGDPEPASGAGPSPEAAVDALWKHLIELPAEQRITKYQGRSNEISVRLMENGWSGVGRVKAPASAIR